MPTIFYTSKSAKKKPKLQRKTLWRLWAKALGEKSGSSEREADIIALIRTVILLIYIITNIFIVSGIIRHW